MKYKELKYEKNFHVSFEDRFLLEKIQTTIELEEGDTIHSVAEQANKDLWQIHKERNPHLYRQVQQVSSEGNGLGENTFKGVDIINSNTQPSVATPTIKSSIPLSKEQREKRDMEERVATIMTYNDPSKLDEDYKMWLHNPEIKTAVDFRKLQLKKQTT